MQTNIKRVYGTGDVQDHEYRQAVTAAKTYCMTALITQRWLSAYNLIQEDEITPKTQEEQYPKESAFVTHTAETFNINDTRHMGVYTIRKLFHKSEYLIVVKYISPN
ncbi:MAG: hypothetical protein ACTMUB_00960 [cyanobacterium endosymbiont of Rhopalodia musculus]|uniref:hypothetical protein n=1 Tax=cyanobacterium endosymbiont of Epithemia clementina EcSB TaxID=3034674 RepID=UPI0024812CE2|nr:hypothetical protein [cyanobacterium endosymbiont of Epithemia clementina EcSB]WGT66838.1 hypothetical protein P3F56_06170 [cyanobacterium endosymbiont of Epithemia clementina EcSB]